VTVGFVVLSRVPQPGVQSLLEMVNVHVTLVLVEPVTVAMKDCCCFTTMVAIDGVTMTTRVLVLLLPQPASARHPAARPTPVCLENLRHFIPNASPAFALSERLSRDLSAFPKSF
jgi:hypothetical protein